MTSAAPTLPLFPQDLEAEQSVLGAVLLDRTSLDQALDLLDEQDFSRVAHRKIFAAMVELSEANEEIDSITLAERLKARGDLEAVGGCAYLAELVHVVPSAANVRAHARIVRGKAQRRRLIQLGAALQFQAQDEQQSIPDLLESVERDLLAIHEGTRSGGDIPLGEVVMERLTRLQELQHNPSAIIGLPTGFSDLDTLLAGLQPGNLIVIGARPSAGKTSLALNIAAHVALQETRPVQIFSLEMTKQELTDRLLSATASVSLHALRTARVGHEGWWKLADSAQKLSTSPVFIDDSGSLTISQLRSRARRRRAKDGLALIIVDYLQLIQGRSDAESRQQEISDISRSLKGLAKELNVPIIALSQLNRDLEKRQDKRPILADLRESGAIEQDADVVIFIYRDEVYHEDSPDRGIAEVLVAKHRNGPIGTRRLLFLEQFTRFESKASEVGTVPNGIRQG